MLTLTGTLLRAQLIPGSTNKKTGEVFQPRSVVQVQVDDRRGLAQLVTLTVPDHRPYADMEGKEVSFPVHAYAIGNPVQFVMADKA